MTEKQYNTPCGVIHYWTNDIQAEKQTLVFLPGLTADHRLFDGQVKQFEPTHNVVVWDAPGHGASRPFKLNFSLDDKARFLHGILTAAFGQPPAIHGVQQVGKINFLLGVVTCESRKHGAQHAGLHQSLADALGQEPATVMLLSTKEYKKTSMTFFQHGHEG